MVSKVLAFKLLNQTYNQKSIPNNNIIAKLKLIGKLEPGQKINTKGCYLQTKSLYTSIVRFLSQETSIETLSFLRSIIDDSFELIQIRLNSKDDFNILSCKNIIQDIIKSTKGLINIKTTYFDEGDLIVSGDIEILIEDINMKLEILKKTNPILFDDKTELKTN